MRHAPFSTASPLPSACLAVDLSPDPRRRSSHLHGLARWLAGGLVLGLLAVVSIPAWSQTSGRGRRVKSLSNAKQIALALRVFAMDNDGVYPREGTPAGFEKPTNSNAAFAVMFPMYMTSETVYGDATSAYQTHAADNRYGKSSPDAPHRTLEAGENVYADMMGLTDAANALFPLVADGTDGTGHYTADATRLGGVGTYGEVIVIRADNSGALEHLAGPATVLYVPLGAKLAGDLAGKPDDNLLDAKLYGKGVQLLDPAVDAAGGRH